MNKNERERGIIDQRLLHDNRPQAEETLPPWLFRHNDLIRTMAHAEQIDKKKLTNILNLLHFKGDPLYALLNHPQYEEEILVGLHPEPCLGQELICRWDQAYSGYNLERYQFKYLIISHDQSIILVSARILATGVEGLTIELPEVSLVTSKRQSPRFRCRSVKAEIWQNSLHAEGELVDFSPHAFRIRVHAAPATSLKWFNTDASATICLANDRHVYYSANCQCLYQQLNGRGRDLIITPIPEQRQDVKGHVMRNPRRQSLPPLHAVFEHPFTKKMTQREIFDISTSGFSIYDNPDDAVLIPGMVIPAMTITYAGILKIHCKVQVAYRKEESSIRFGISILDMDLTNYTQLNQLLNNIPGTDRSTTNEVDPDQLWELFFESDFIYPAKYKHLQTYRESFRETYRRLYQEANDIAKHFTYQKNGRIYSHISMVRAYEQAWMMHHHAALSKEGRYTGLIVLRQMICYLYDMRRLPSAHLDYYMCYYRPGHKFTDRIYSGFVREKAEQSSCSLDLFTYMTYSAKGVPAKLPEGWSLRTCSASDLWELERFYKHHSGGLLWEVLSLDHPREEPLEALYARMGFIRRWKAMALHDTMGLKAVIIVNESDVALNLSDLLNCFKILVLDPNVPAEILFAAIENIAQGCLTETFPLLIYPSDYAKHQGLAAEKQYLLWILDTQISHEFIEYLGRKFRMKFV